MYLVDWAKIRIIDRRSFRAMKRRDRERLRQARNAGRRPGRIVFHSGRPRPDSTINAIAARLGLEPGGGPEGADVVFSWQIEGMSGFHEPPPELLELARTRKVLNIGATDISKTSVARAFEEAFGYPLLLDPRTHTGPAVEKPEGNGLRAGRIIECPADPKAGFCYQRLIDNRLEGDDLRTFDLRVAVYGDATPYLVRKERSIGARFGNVLETRFTPTVQRPEDFLTGEELRQVVGMARGLGADFCEIDCIRDRESGLLYAVDVNTAAIWFDGFGREAAEDLVEIQAEAFEEAFLGGDQSGD